MASGLWWTAKQRCRKIRQAQISSDESSLTSHSVWSVVETAAVSFARNRVGVNIVAEEIRLCKELILFWAEELRLQRENLKVRKNIRSLKQIVHTLNRRRHKMRMEINKLTNQVEDYLEIPQETSHTISSARESPMAQLTRFCEENVATFIPVEAEKLQQESSSGFSLSQIWSQILLEGEPHNPQVVIPERMSNKSPNTTEGEQVMDGEIKEENSKDRESPKCPSLSPSPRLRDGSVSQATLCQDEEEFSVTPQQVKSAIFDRGKKTPSPEITVMKPDIIIHDTEISGLSENRREATNEIMAIIENEVLYHIFPVQVFVDSTSGFPKPNEFSSSAKMIGANDLSKENSEKEDDRGTLEDPPSTSNDPVSFMSKSHRSISVLSSDSRSRRSSNKASLAECNNQHIQNTTVETYMHYVYGGELAPRRQASKKSLSDDFAFVISGEELLPRFDPLEGGQLAADDVEKKMSQNSFSSEMTDLSSDFEGDSKEILILDLAIDSQTAAAASSHAPEIGANKGDLSSRTSQTTITEGMQNPSLSERRSLHRIRQKSKTIRKAPQKVKKFFCLS